eukprot:TRINITY_DN18867_c1_g1_i1.p1 TRINITY_DN18867_c1_g1~~TRINITY_DN18867_c1_g1_i1.p1  ORF type:complete len:487 (+),score=43.01 TRINITY_DN18867_c1_g1_i1:84-1544(+)
MAANDTSEVPRGDGPTAQPQPTVNAVRSEGEPSAAAPPPQPSPAAPRGPANPADLAPTALTGRQETGQTLVSPTFPPPSQAAGHSGLSVSTPHSAPAMRPSGSVSSLDLHNPSFAVGLYQQDTCSVCLERYTVANPAMMYACGHCFHFQCAESWAQRSRLCPLCWEPLHEAQLFTGDEPGCSPSKRCRAGGLLPGPQGAGPAAGGGCAAAPTPSARSSPNGERTAQSPRRGSPARASPARSASPGERGSPPPASPSGREASQHQLTPGEASADPRCGGSPRPAAEQRAGSAAGGPRQQRRRRETASPTHEDGQPQQQQQQGGQRQQRRRREARTHEEEDEDCVDPSAALLAPQRGARRKGRRAAPDASSGDAAEGRPRGRHRRGSVQEGQPLRQRCGNEAAATARVTPASPAGAAPSGSPTAPNRGVDSGSDVIDDPSAMDAVSVEGSAHSSLSGGVGHVVPREGAPCCVPLRQCLRRLFACCPTA